MVEDNSNRKDAIRKSRRAFCITCAVATAGVILRYFARPVEAKDVAPKQVKLVEFQIRVNAKTSSQFP